MIKFFIAGRRKPTESQESYFYNWAIIHVALMLTTPIVFQTFRRYVQHFSISGVAGDLLWHPLSPQAWDSFSEHWLDGFDALVRNITDPGYRARMQPHAFSDSTFLIEFNGGRTLFEQPGFAPGGLKLIHFVQKRPELSQRDFEQRWGREHGPAVVDALRPLGIPRKYVQSPRLEFDPKEFRGTFFEVAQFGRYAGIEEFWLNSLDDLRRLADDPGAMRRIRASESALISEQDTFSMVVKERVVFDNTVPGKESPMPAVLRPGSLEALIDAQGYGDWSTLHR